MSQPALTNTDVERIALQRVMALERAAGREPVDVHLQGDPFDVRSDPRKIEVKAFGGSARSVPLPLEHRQVDAWRADPENFYVYVVDNVRAGADAMTVRVLHGEVLAGMVTRTQPVATYWPTLRAAEYDTAEQISDLG
jgi:hypothetical protein